MSTDCAHDRIVAIGDLNGSVDVLRQILHGNGLIDSRDRWIGDRTHLLQLGDIFDRGGGRAIECLHLLQALREQAPETGGQVTQLLGNHEVMAAVGDERWCMPDEYLTFATEDEKQQWPALVAQARQKIEGQHPGLPEEVMNSLLESWKRSAAPGRDALERALSKDGHVGQMLRTLPVATIVEDMVFCHAGLTPEWAKLGLDGLEQRRLDAWRDPKDGQNIFNSQSGPLWSRQLSMGGEMRVHQMVDDTLGILGVKHMIVGHTPTGHVPGGTPSRIATRCHHKLVCIDVGLVSGRTGVALVVDRHGGFEWTPRETRLLWTRR